ncbi:MAG: argininosuccinate lyase [Candidatus Pacebacteria bacterium]|nr:argininosuccinate lyase [Candidatus Paceibacterota bacterium]
MSKTVKLWDKGTKSNSIIENYLAGDDIFLDQQLVQFDVYGSLAHCKMLYQNNLIEKIDFDHLTKGLKQILKLNKDGQFNLSLSDEDIHTKVENYLTEIYPESGGKLHTGRSRNDQVLVDIRLYSKDQLTDVIKLVINLISDFQIFSKKHEFLPMAGYTHMQQAMLSSVGLWADSFTQSLLDDLTVVQTAYDLNDQSPLGSGAAYGVSLPIDRELTAKLLGFKKVQTNALYCQNSKGKIESTIIHSLSSIMNTLSKFAQDILLFTTSEFNYFSVPKSLTTGSSIMPQKNNHDAMELLRGKTKVIQSYYSLVSSINSDLPSGYNRDTQLIKQPLFESFKITKESLQVVSLYVNSLIPNKENIKKNISKELFAAHHAYQLMKKNNWSFRKAYSYVGKNLDKIPNYDPIKVLKETTTLGGPGNLQLDSLDKNLLRQSLTLSQRKQNTHQTMSKININNLRNKNNEKNHTIYKSCFT